jgi:hypothetical protein
MESTVLSPGNLREKPEQLMPSAMERLYFFLHGMKSALILREKDPETEWEALILFALHAKLADELLLQQEFRPEE